MCGLAGIYSTTAPLEAALAAAMRMRDALNHRGPDSSGLWTSPETRLILAHRRLAIQDLSPAGAQPMLSDSGRYCLAFNGEIYNFLKVRRSLETAGHRFRGHSDTEVLLAAIERFGLESALSECAGMFALALWDTRDHVLHLARDRLGEKPLYCGVVENTLLFGSEVKAILAGCEYQRLELDADAVASFLKYGYISAPRSIFSTVKKLKPGHILSISLGSGALPTPQALAERQKPYWALPQTSNVVPQDEIDDASAVSELDTLLREIVAEQAISDVPLGCFLSGGVDSSLVSAVLQAQSSSPVRTFTIGFDDLAFNEAPHAQAVASHLGSDHTALYVSPRDALDTVPQMAEIYDEPFADSSQVPTYLVCKLARSQVTVCLAGDGGDELFGGYNRYLWAKHGLAVAARLPEWVKRPLARGVTRIPEVAWDSVSRTAFRLARRKGPAAVGNKLHKLAHLAELKSADAAFRYLSAYWPEPQDVLRQNSGSLDDMPPHISLAHFYRDAMAWDQAWYLPGDNLVKTDRASMAVSLEVRLPLLDHRLVEFSARLPDRMKIRGVTTKWLLRELLYRYVPRRLIDRPKMGFSVPIAGWLRGDLRDWSYDLLSTTRLDRDGFFDSGTVSRIHAEHMSGRCDHSAKLWTLLMFNAWHDRWRRVS